MIRILFIIAFGLVTLGAATVNVNAKNTRQTIEGFGTCLVSWSDYASIYDDAFADIYTQTMGFNILRMGLAAWAYPQTENPKDISPDKIDINATQNSRVRVFLDFAKKLKKRRDDLKIIATVWSPVPWLKVNNSTKDKAPGSLRSNDYIGKSGEIINRVKPEYYLHYVRWMIAQAQRFALEGVPLYAMSPGNEVMFTQGFESCVWSAKDFATIVALLGEELDKSKMGDIKIYGPETMTQNNRENGNILYINELRKNPLAWKHLDIFATHGYVDGFKEDTRSDSSLAFWNLIKDFDKSYWMTEGGTGDHEWPKPLTGVAAAVHNSLVAGNASAFVPWQISDAKSNQHGLMVGRTLTKKSHAIRHYSSFIVPGSKRIALDNESGDLRVSAFYHVEKKRLVIVVVNPSQKSEDLLVSLDSIKAKKVSVYRTSASEDVARTDSFALKQDQFKSEIVPECIMTFVVE